jgi:hypothetical protein
MTVKAVAMTPLTLTDGTIVWDGSLGNLASVTLTQASNLNGIGNVAPGTYVLRVIQDGTGGHALTFGENFKSVNGDVIEVAAGAGSISILTILNSGGSDLYVMGQANFISFGSAPPFEGDVPFTVIVSGITPTSPTNLNGTYERTGDENDLPAWQLLIDPLNRVVIHADSEGYYFIDVQDRAVDTDPWTTIATHYEITTIGGDVTVGPWVESGIEYTGDVEVTPDVVTPAYVLTNEGTSAVIYLYPKDDAVWYSDPVAPGNAYAAINGGSKLLLVDADGTGYWELGIEASNGIGEFIAFQYHVDLITTALPVGPLGGYGSIVTPATPPDYNNPTIGAANYTVTAFTP